MRSIGSTEVLNVAEPDDGYVLAHTNTVAVLNVTAQIHCSNSEVRCQGAKEHAALIIYRLWSVDRETSRFAPATEHRGAPWLRRVIRILIESASLYTVGVVIFVITHIKKSNASYGVSDTVRHTCPL